MVGTIRSLNVSYVLSLYVVPSVIAMHINYEEFILSFHEVVTLIIYLN